MADKDTQGDHQQERNDQKLLLGVHVHPPETVGVPGWALAGPPATEVCTYCLVSAGSGGCSGFGALSPINRTLLSRSDTRMPESASNSAGTCAAILVTSPVSL